ncbi:MAG: spore maturation protein [Clostridium sp.]|uniref:nucleoside recognition domain-containing protein n=1 Tax=Clostridium sp. TaxID=1506 RepID=UPI002A8677F0|nr:spore maturation protein [Clostridium sp.]MDY5097515.1 nucleoside recognition domain-containing protein [Clostridium sp.]
MINYIWFFMILIGVIFGIFTGQGQVLSEGIVGAATSTVELIFGMIGLMCMWCGVMKIAEKSGLMDKLAKALRPFLKLIFKDAAKDSKALGAIVMNLTANMMGLSNAATPFGIKAMEEMDRLNPKKGEASDDMILFLVLNAACIQLVPSTVISLRAAQGSTAPGIIIIPAMLATGTAALVGIIVCKVMERYF